MTDSEDVSKTAQPLTKKSKNDQLTTLWHAYIGHQVKANTSELSKPLSHFLTNATIDFMDYEEFEYGEYGDIGIRYVDFLYNEEEIEVRLIDSVDDSFEPMWGFPHKKPKSHFDIWLSSTLGANEIEKTCTLLWVERFLRTVLKNND